MPAGQNNYNWMSCIPVSSQRPEIRLRFTDYSALAGTPAERYLFMDLMDNPPWLVTINDCYLRGAYQNVHSRNKPNLIFTLSNNLLERNYWTYCQDAGINYPFTLTLNNNLFW